MQRLLAWVNCFPLYQISTVYFNLCFPRSQNSTFFSFFLFRKILQLLKVVSFFKSTNRPALFYRTLHRHVMQRSLQGSLWFNMYTSFTSWLVSHSGQVRCSCFCSNTKYSLKHSQIMLIPSTCVSVCLYLYLYSYTIKVED